MGVKTSRRSSNRKDSYAQLTFFNDKDRTLFQVSLMLSKRSDHKITHMIWKDIKAAYLENARTSLVSQSQNRAEVQIVSKHDVAVLFGPIHDRTIGRLWIANG